MSRYPDEEAINILLDQHLTMVAPATKRFHFHHGPMHTRARLTVCAFQGFQRLMFEAHVWPDHISNSTFHYFGTGDCFNHTGIDPRVELLMNRYPDAHILFEDNEQEGDELIFGYVAYDDDWKAIDFAPIPMNDADEPDLNAIARLADRLPEGIEDTMDKFKQDYDAGRRI